MTDDPPVSASTIKSMIRAMRHETNSHEGTKTPKDIQKNRTRKQNKQAKTSRKRNRG